MAIPLPRCTPLPPLIRLVTSRHVHLRQTTPPITLTMLTQPLGLSDPGGDPNVQRFIRDGSIGIGEAYMEGHWTPEPNTPDGLKAIFKAFANHYEVHVLVGGYRTLLRTLRNINLIDGVLVRHIWELHRQMPSPPPPLQNRTLSGGRVPSPVLGSGSGTW